MKVNSYLRRIGIEVDKENLLINRDTLRLLQSKHILSIPFENLDVMNNVPIILEINRLYDKIVKKKRRLLF